MALLLLAAVLLLLLQCLLPSAFAASSNNYTLYIGWKQNYATAQRSPLTAADLIAAAELEEDGHAMWVHLPVLPAPKQARRCRGGSNNHSLMSLGHELGVSVRIAADDSVSNHGEVLRMVRLSVERFAGKCRKKEEAVVKQQQRYNTVYFRSMLVHIIDKEAAFRHHQQNEGDGSPGGRNESIAHMDQYHHIRLDSPLQSITIHATTHKGVMHALATLAQLLASPLLLPLPLCIADWPDNAWRGLLVDVSRHFQPMPLLKRMVDGLEHSKMNVLHLHLSDSQSFPVLLRDTADLPLSQLARHSVFSADKTYSLSELAELVAYAHERGVEVVPEIDVPAHVRSWGAAPAFKGIVVNCSRTAGAAQTPVNTYLINPIDPLAMRVISEVVRQIASVFNTSRYFHIGGDEVNFDCWREDGGVAAHLLAKNTSVEEVLRDFEREVFSVVRSLDKVPVVWQDSFDGHSLPSESNSSSPTLRAAAVVQPWKCWSGLAVRSAKAAAEGGYRVVMSACWYLDYEEDWTAYLAASALSLAKTAVAQSGGRSRGVHRLLQHRGADVAVASGSSSSSDRCLTADSPVHSDYFLGGEGSMWTENVDHSNLECRVWPRAGAVAAKLWGFSTQHSPQQRRSLSIAETKSLLLTVAAYRTFLFVHLGVKAADLVFHSPYTGVVTKSGTARNETVLLSRSINDFATAARHILANVKCGLTLPSANDIAGPHSSRCVRLTSSCLGIPEKIQRPYRLDKLRIGQLNVADGSTGGRNSKMLQWLQKKAQEGVMVIGLCELNGWQEMESTTTILKNFPKMRFRAANAGFSHSHVMANSQPYNIGIVSAVPFDVLGEYGPPLLQRGLLHVHYPELSLHLLTAHLHAHDSTSRERECQFIVRLAQSIIADADAAGMRGVGIVLMGDLNTLSPHDSAQHADEGLLSTLQRSDHAVFARLGKKFLDGGRAAINYRPMQLLLDAGFKDVCVEICARESASGVNGSSSVTWSLERDDPFSRCMRRQCPYTEPTKYSPEWPHLSDNLAHPRIRLDYILALGEQGVANAFVDINEDSELFSDHFPVFVDFAQDVHLF